MVGDAPRRRWPTGPTRRSRPSRAAIGNTEGESESSDIRSLHAGAGGGIHEGAGSALEADQAGIRRDDPVGETEPVMVHIHEGPGTAGKEVVDVESHSLGRQMVGDRRLGAAGTGSTRRRRPEKLDRERGRQERSRRIRSLHGRPEVRITHGPEARSKQSKPTFEGEASETEPVTVTFRRSGTGGKKVATLSSDRRSPQMARDRLDGLARGKYTAEAKEPSSIGNDEGESDAGRI